MRNRTKEQVEACRSLLPEARFEVFRGWLVDCAQAEARSLLYAASDSELRMRQGRLQVLEELLTALDRKALDDALERFNRA